jgi:hypothetical protein
MKINYYDKLYFLLYSLLALAGKYDVAFKAMMLFSAMIFIHVITIVFVIYERSDIVWLASYLGVIIMGLPILIFNYFYFVYKKRYQKISDKLRVRAKTNVVLGGVIYLIVSIVLLLIVIIK